MRNPFVSKALEGIDFQSDAFLKALSINVVALGEVPEKDRADSDIVAAMTKTIADYTGLNVNLTIGVYYPQMEIPRMHKNNVLINNYRKNFMTNAAAIKMVQNADSVVSGAVDRRTGRVSGVFSEVPISIYMPSDIFGNSKYLPEEVAAILMHECGHAVSFFDCFGETASTNQALQGIARGLEDSDVKVRISVLETAKKKFNLKDFDVEKLSTASPNTVQVVFIANQAVHSQSLMGRNVYDLSSFEYLSDQFVARHGGARYLSTGLAKIYKGKGDIAFRSLPAYLAVEMIKVALLLYIPALSGLLFAMDGQGNGEYDRPGARLKRVRNQVIEQLKDKKLSKDEVENLEMDILAIDELLNQANDRRQWLEIITNTLWIPTWKDRSTIKLQQELEDLAANDLFAKSAQWRAMA